MATTTKAMTSKSKPETAIEKKDFNFLIEASEGHTSDSDFDSKDFSYGWLRIAQAKMEKTISGVSEADFFSSLSEVSFGSSVRVVPLKYFRSYAAYDPDDNTKFLYSITAEDFSEMNLPRKGSKFTGENGETIKEQFNYMVYLPDYPEEGIMRFANGAGSFVPVRAWNTLLRNKFILDSNGHRIPVEKHFQVWTLDTVFAKNKSGKSWYTFNPYFSEFVSKAQVEDMKSMVMILSDFVGKATPVEDTEDDDTIM